MALPLTIFSGRDGTGPANFLPTVHPYDLDMLETTADLCRIPSPTGFTKNVVDEVANRLESFGLTVERTVKGSLVASFPGNDDHRVARSPLARR